MTAPAFEATAADGSTVAFTPGEAEKPIVLTFYRGGWWNSARRSARRSEAALRSRRSNLPNFGGAQLV